MYACTYVCNTMYVPTDRLRSVWRQSLYVSLIRGSLVRGDEELALHMLSELRRWGYVVSTMAYEYLLQSVNHPRHLQQYLPVSAWERVYFQSSDFWGGSQVGG